MNTITKYYKTIDNQNILVVNASKQFTGIEAPLLRSIIDEHLNSEINSVYLDMQHVGNMDLSGINEVIHSHFTLNTKQKHFLFIYSKNSTVNEWVTNTKLDQFITTALLPERKS